MISGGIEKLSRENNVVLLYLERIECLIFCYAETIIFEKKSILRNSAGMLYLSTDIERDSPNSNVTPDNPQEKAL